MKRIFIILAVLITAIGASAQVPYEWPIIKTELGSELTTINQTIKSKGSESRYCTQFAANLENASSIAGYSLFSANPYPGVLPDIAHENEQLARIDTMLMNFDSLGYTGVEITMAYPLLVDSFPYMQTYLDFYKQVYAMAHSMGIKIIQHNTCAIGDTTGLSQNNGGALLSNDVLNYYYKSELNGHPDTINSQRYRASMLQMMQTVIDSLQPDYLTMQEEPITEVGNTYGFISFTPDSTLSYVKYWCDNLKHKGTMLWGAGAISTDKEQYFINYATVNKLDYLDYHLFTANNTSMIPAVFTIDSIAKANGKQVVVGECWCHAESDSEETANTYPGHYSDLADERDIFNYFEQKDTLFEQAMINLSQLEDIPFVNFFRMTEQNYYLTYKNSYHLPSEKADAESSVVENMETDSANANMHNRQLGALGKFTKKAIQAALSRPSIPTAGNNGPVCVGSPLTLTASTISGATYSWTGPNGFTSSSKNPTVSSSATTAMSGTYSVNATITGGCASIDGTTTVTVNPSIPASVNITANPSGAICSGTAVTFTATPTNGGTTPAYQWQLNGNNISDTNPTHTTKTLANGDVITCVMTSDAACITGSPVDTSNAITVTVNPDASITSVTGTSPLCISGTATYSENGVVLGGGTGAWSSSNTAVATVNSSGLVTGVSAGTCNIRYIITGGCGGTVSALQSVTINQPTTGDTTATACTSFKWYGTTYTSSGTHTHILTNKKGCDSTVTLHLTINQPTTGDTTAIACTSFKWYGTTYTSSGTHTHILTNKKGCDSTLTLHLTINQSTTGDTTATACTSFKWYGTTYTSTGTHTHILTNKKGCDSTVTLHLTVNPEPVETTSLNGYTIMSNQAGAAYQWIICPAMTYISGATNQSYTATADGDYAVIVTLGECSDTSACVSIVITGIGKVAADNQFTIYPNPAKDEIQVIGEQSTVIGIDVYNMLGERVYQSLVTGHSLSGVSPMTNAPITNTTITINVADFPRGVYMVEVRTEKGVAVSKFIKE